MAGSQSKSAAAGLSSTEVVDEQPGETTTTPKLPDQFADESYKLFSQVQVSAPTPEEANRIRKKCVRWILPFLCFGYHLMYIDKQTVCDAPVSPPDLSFHVLSSRLPFSVPDPLSEKTSRRSFI